MKTKHVLEAVTAVSVAAVIFGIYTVIGERGEPASEEPESGKTMAGTDISGNGLFESTADYTTYETELGDYRISFDFLAGLKPYDSGKTGGTMLQDYYSEDRDFIVIAAAPAKWNVNNNRPGNAEDYAEYCRKTQSGDVVSETMDAEDYRDGEYYGVKYRKMTEYSFGKAYVMGYDLYHGDDYMYIFVQRSDRMPADIRNIRIEKIR